MLTEEKDKIILTYNFNIDGNDFLSSLKRNQDKQTYIEIVDNKNDSYIRAYDGDIYDYQQIKSEMVDFIDEIL